jgi:hypothetical protein
MIMNNSRSLSTVAALSALLIALAAATMAWAAGSETAGPGAPRASARISTVRTVASPDRKQVPAVTSSPSPVLGCSSNWNIIPIPSVVTASNHLLGVSALSLNNIWAVGNYDYSTWNGSLIEHWDGTRWSVIDNPQLSHVLYDVKAISKEDVWAVGTGNFIEHWDGRQWSVVPTPDPGNLHYFFKSIASASANDIWVVGELIDDYSGSSRTLIEHWDGTRWSVILSPNVGVGSNKLAHVAVVSTNDVWAAGFYDDAGRYRTLIMHWDGSAWRVAPSPNTGGGSNWLTGISALSPNDAWAVGYYLESQSQRTQTVIMRWDGSQWNVVPSPNQGTGLDNSLDGVVALTGSSEWAVGSYFDAAAGRTQTLAERWDGTRWKVERSPNFDAKPSSLHSVAVDPAGNIWSVGDYDSLYGWRTLALRYGDPCQVTPTATPTACVVAFTDLPQGNVFYPFVRCLVCGAVVSGYSDSTFRPNNQITRGQLAKYVSNAADIEGDPSYHWFEDVPPGSTYYLFVERLANWGIVDGYACGTEPGEPCVPPANRLYFRPNANATRGQIAKVVSDAARYWDPRGAQIFEDVPPDSAFYVSIQRLASRGIVNGYTCGGPGEPCGPQALPYFRPGQNTTRGQASKMVAGTFFPGCNPRAQP